MTEEDLCYGDYFYVAVMKDGSERIIRSHLMRAKPSEIIADRRKESPYWRALDIGHLKTCDIFGRQNEATNGDYSHLLATLMDV